ncbi:hypothetical protein BpHYR1_033683 [Brachionus plicatilis]|uniref:Transmembrane protein n=1 Tax=Brachionus plicatilis TaxID=10195 RepID=A0A3M7Q877_BRAPC|nr:hypothetical protein BpHYR1_033683 [Brachionus plicatilis]
MQLPKNLKQKSRKKLEIFLLFNMNLLIQIIHIQFLILMIFNKKGLKQIQLVLSTNKTLNTQAWIKTFTSRLLKKSLINRLIRFGSQLVLLYALIILLLSLKNRLLMGYILVFYNIRWLNIRLIINQLIRILLIIENY